MVDSPYGIIATYCDMLPHGCMSGAAFRGHCQAGTRADFGDGHNTCEPASRPENARTADQSGTFVERSGEAGLHNRFGHLSPG
jgi:hypothetical protein